MVRRKKNTVRQQQEIGFLIFGVIIFNNRENRIQTSEPPVTNADVRTVQLYLWGYVKLDKEIIF